MIDFRGERVIGLVENPQSVKGRVRFETLEVLPATALGAGLKSIFGKLWEKTGC